MVKKVKLISICKPKQYKTLSKIDLIENGKFPVYGANGIIGKSDKFTHENPTLMVTCRGATCGTLNISEPNSYINGNAMAFDDINEEFDLKYLYYYLFTRGFNDVISGSAQPQITRENLKNLEVLKPLLEQQNQIAKTLDKANELIELRKESITKLDALAKSIFIDMFGDPVSNPKKWEIKKIVDLGKVQTGNTPPRIESDNYGDFIEWIKSDNILKDKMIITEAREYLSEKGYRKGRIADKGSLLFTCIAGSMSSIGNLAMTDRQVTFNQQINSLTPYDNNELYLYSLFKLCKKFFEENSTKSMKIMINKSNFENLLFPIAPIKLQNKFAKIIEKIEEQKTLYTQELEKLQNNFDALLQKSFQE